MVWGFTAPKSWTSNNMFGSSLQSISDWRPLWSTSSSSSIWKLLICSTCSICSTCAPSTFVRASLGFTLCGIHLGRPPTASKDSLIIATSKPALSSSPWDCSVQGCPKGLWHPSQQCWLLAGSRNAETSFAKTDVLPSMSIRSSSPFCPNLGE